MVMSPQYFRSDIVYDVDLSEHKKLQGKWITATTVVCCILMQICVVSQKNFRLCSWTLLGYFRPPEPQSSFMSSPNNPVRSTPLPCR